MLTGGPWTPHDLRRTGATMMGELGVIGEVIERCLNHVEQNKLKRIYQRHELKAEKREAWRLLGERLQLLLSSETHENVDFWKFKSLDLSRIITKIDAPASVGLYKQMEQEQESERLRDRKLIKEVEPALKKAETV